MNMDTWSSMPGGGDATGGVNQDAGSSEQTRQVREQAKRAKRGLERLLDEQPFVIGVLALLLGGLIALLLPRTRREDALMGAQSDTLLARAKEVAGKTLESAKEVAGKTFESAKETATQELGGLKEDAKDTAQRAAQAAQKTAESAKETAKASAKESADQIRADQTKKE